MTATMPETVDRGFSDYLTHCQQRIDAVLPALLGAAGSEFSEIDAQQALTRLFEAQRYALLGGGKRVRASLVYAAAGAVGCSAELDGALDTLAAAVEMIHGYSLVHDDLPAMDDDDLRRGQATCHIAFDEATAILVGDGLQSRAFELISDCESLPATARLAMIRLLAGASGSRGMVGGQAIDLQAVNRELDLGGLQTMHQLKTGALIRAAVGLGALAGGASPQQQQQLDRYGQAIGLAFQVQDDILDVESSTETLGKTQGADLARNKPTFPSLLGMAGAKALALELEQQAQSALLDFDAHAEPLRALARYIIARQH